MLWDGSPGFPYMRFKDNMQRSLDGHSRNDTWDDRVYRWLTPFSKIAEEFRGPLIPVTGVGAAAASVNQGPTLYDRVIAKAAERQSTEYIKIMFELLDETKLTDKTSSVNMSSIKMGQYDPNETVEQ